VPVLGLRANIADAAIELARCVIYVGDYLEDNPIELGEALIRVL